MTSEDATFIKNIQEVTVLLDNDFDRYKSVLDQVGVEISKNSKHNEAYISFINNQLSKSETRKRGLILLRFYLPFCTSDILEEHAAAWLNNSLKNCKNEATIQDDAYKVIKPLLESCYGSPDLNRSVTSGTLSKIIENITKINYNSNDSISALKCLETCLKLYPGSCLPSKTSIENFILTFVDCTSQKVVLLAGRCFLACQQIGGGGTRGSNHKEAWKKQHLNLCLTIHLLIDELFESILELGFATEENTVPILLPDLPNGDRNKLTLNRVINLIIFQQQMFLIAFPVPKSVFPNVILYLVNRGLSITKDNFGEQIIDNALKMSSNLFIIHKYLLQLLQALMVCLGNDLVPYATQICKLIINNLKLTKSKNTANIRALCDSRIAAYQTLSIWITISKGASCVSTFSDHLLSEILNDITPQITELNLMVQNTSLKNLSKKNKRKMQQEQITQSGIAKNYSPINRKTLSASNEYQSKICCEALNFLQTLLINCSYQLKPAFHKQMQEFIVKTLFKIQRGSILSPFDDIKCKTGLYKTLIILVQNHHWNISPPTEYAIQLLSKGQIDSNPDIAFICSSAISSLRNFIHPPCATLQFPLDLDTLRSELDLDQDKQTTNDLELVESEDKIMEAEDESEMKENKESETEETGSVDNMENDDDTGSKTEGNTEEGNANVENDNTEEKGSVGDKDEVEVINIEDDLLKDDDMECQIIEEKAEKTESKIDKVSPAEIIDLEEEDMLSSFVDVIND